MPSFTEILNQVSPVSSKGAESAKKNLIGEGLRGSHEQGNGQDLIKIFPKTWQLTLKLDCDHTWRTKPKNAKCRRKHPQGYILSIHAFQARPIGIYIPDF